MSSLFRVTLIVLVAITTPFLILSLVGQLAITPIAGLVSLLIGAVYALVLLAILRKTPIWPKGETTGTWWVLCALLWGAGVSYAVAAAVGFSAIDMAVALNMEDAFASFGGAWPEEAAKALGVLFVLMSFRRFNRPWHGFVVGMVVGLGFEAAENAMYGALLAPFHPVDDMLGMLQTWGVRSVFLPFLHIAWTGAVGWAIGLALFVVKRSFAWRIQVVAVYFLYAFGCHFAWNYMLDDYTAFIVKAVIVGVVMYAVWVYVWVKAWRGATGDQTYVFTQRPLTKVADLASPAGGNFTPTDSDLRHTKTA